MALLPQNQRDQLMLLGCAAALGLVYAYHTWVWTDKNTALDETQTRVEKLETMNRKAKSDLARGSVTKLKDEAARLRGELDLMRQLVPTGHEVPALLDQVSTAARRAGLELGDVAPEPVVTGTDFDVQRYTMSVIGDYHSIGAFLTNVGSLTRIMTTQNVTLAPSAKRIERRLPPNTAMLEARFQVQTYVAHASVPAATTTTSTGEVVR
jgi:type IV pilus assembly protein PilO